jgi:hypothetical protein
MIVGVPQGRLLTALLRIPISSTTPKLAAWRAETSAKLLQVPVLDPSNIANDLSAFGGRQSLRMASFFPNRFSSHNTGEPERFAY